MLAIPDTVLRKSGPLEAEEFELMKSHTTVGDSLCGNLRSLAAVRPIIRHHHERHDGSGYPDGLAGDDIPLLAQIIGIVDVYDAVTTRRPYQGPHSAQEAIDILRDQVSRGWRRPDLRRSVRRARRERPPEYLPIRDAGIRTGAPGEDAPGGGGGRVAELLLIVTKTSASCRATRSSAGLPAAAASAALSSAGVLTAWPLT